MTPAARGTDWLAALRDADWMTAERASAWRAVLLVATPLSVGKWIALSHQGIDPLGKPFGTDFLSFWTAARVALSGAFADAYDIPTHWAAQTVQFPTSSLGYEAFFYPPTFLLMCLPLGLVPYFWALAGWLLATGFACWRALRFCVDKTLSAATFLAFPAVLLNMGFGQNAFLTTALYGAAVGSLSRRPVLAGFWLGVLAFKPHLLVAVPIALLVARRWSTLAAAAITAAGVALLSLAVLGVETWRGFFAHVDLARAVLEQDLVDVPKMQSVWAATRLFGAPVTVCYSVQGIVALAALAALVRIARALSKETLSGPSVLGAAIVAAVPLTTPFLLSYDLMLLAIPALCLWNRARLGGFLPWEKVTLLSVFVLPMVAVPAAARLAIPLTPAVAAALLAALARRARTDRCMVVPGSPGGPGMEQFARGDRRPA